MRTYADPIRSLYMCPQTLYARFFCPHTTTHVSSYYNMCPHTAIYLSSYYCMCVLTPLHMCPHTNICVLLLLYVSSHHYICVLTLLCVLILRYMSSYHYICVLILPYMCPHTTICVLYVFFRYIGARARRYLLTGRRCHAPLRSAYVSIRQHTSAYVCSCTDIFSLVAAVMHLSGMLT
jgi:hypothetical protein